MEARSAIGFLLLLVLTCAVVFLIYKTYTWLNKGNDTDVTILDKPVKMEADMHTCSGILPPSGNEHTYSFWIYITHWDVTPSSPKYIFKRTHAGNTLNVAAGESFNELQVFITNNDTGEKVARNSSTGLDDDHTHRLTNLPLQAFDKGALTIGGSSEEPILNGFLSRFQYFGRVVSPRDIYSIYMKGPAKKSDLSNKPNTSQLTLDLSVGQTPECATAN